METRILLLADINSAHTQKWAIGLAQSGYKIGIFSFNPPESNWYESYNIDCLHKQSIFKSSNKFIVKLTLKPVPCSAVGPESSQPCPVIFKPLPLV